MAASRVFSQRRDNLRCGLMLPACIPALIYVGPPTKWPNIRHLRSALPQRSVRRKRKGSMGWLTTQAKSTYARCMVSVWVPSGKTMVASSARRAPLIPERVVAPLTRYSIQRYSIHKNDILDDKAIFQCADLMDFGSLYGNGAYSALIGGPTICFRPRHRPAAPAGGGYQRGLPTQTL